MAFGLDGKPGHIVFTNMHQTFDLGDFDLSDPKKEKPDDDVPIAMNCTSFSNLALSIWRTGNAHGAPYDSSQDVGGFNPLGSRYGLRYLRNPNSSPLSAPSDAQSLAWLQNYAQTPTPSRLLPRSTPTVTLPTPLAPENYDTYFYRVQDVVSVTTPHQLYYLEFCHIHATKSPLKKHAINPSGFGHHDTVLLDGYVYETNISNPALRKSHLTQRLRPTDAVRVMGPA